MTRVHIPHDGALPRRITVLVEIDTDPLTDDEADEAAALAAAAVARLLPSSTSGDVRAHLPEADGSRRDPRVR